MDGQIEHVYILGMDEQVARIIIPAAMSLGVFVLTQVFTWLRGQVGKRREIVAYREMILKWVKLVEPHVKQQIKECEELAGRIKSAKTMEPEVFSINSFFVDKVDAIGLDRYMNSLVINAQSKLKDNNEKNSKYAFDLIKSFSFLRTREREISRMYGDYKNRLLRNWEEWDNNFETLTKLLGELASSERSDYTTAVVRVYLSWEKDKDSPSHRKSLTEKLLKLKPNVNASLEREFHYRNWKAHYSWEEWEKYNKLWAREFEEEAKSLKGALTSLEEASTYFQVKTVVKPFWKIR